MFLTHDSGLTHRPIITQSALTNEEKACNTGYTSFLIDDGNAEERMSTVSRSNSLQYLRML